jgi:ribosomal protein S18 acetylase RimI-like enzyme
MAVQISRPRNDPEGLDELAPLWKELHHHHREVADYQRPDDTFDVTGGLAEVVTLVVSPGHRSDGVGRALLQAAEEIARARGFDTMKIAVMSGNARAQRFYEANGYAVAEHVLYRRLGKA